MTRNEDSAAWNPTRRRVLKAGAATTTALIGAETVAPTAVAKSHCDIVVDASGGGYTTIQDGIDDASPGDTVCVEPGDYDGTVTVDVADLTLTSTEYRGAVVAGGDATTGSAVSIEADGVTIEGFEVSFPDGLLGIAVQSGHDGVTVRNNYVTDVGPVGRLGATGIIGGGPHDDLTIEDNVVDGVTNEVTEESGYPTVNGIFVDDQSDGTLANSTISNNVVRGLRSDVASIGIILGIDAEGVTIAGNEVYDLSADPTNDADDGDDPDGTDYVTYAQGLNVSGGTTDVTFRRNVVDDVTATYFVGTGLKIDGEAEGLTVELNDLLPTVGIENADDDAVAATCNYWGHPKGPREADGNRDADDGPNRQRRSAVVGPADFEPWLVRSVENGTNDENACVGGRGSEGNDDGT